MTVSSISEWILGVQNAPKFYWMATAAAVAHPYTRQVGFRMVSYGVRVAANSTVASMRAVIGTTFVRGGTATLGTSMTALASRLGAVGAGYVIGAYYGTWITGAIWGPEGAKMAIKFYTGQGKYGEYFDVMTHLSVLNAHYFQDPSP